MVANTHRRAQRRWDAETERQTITTLDECNSLSLAWATFRQLQTDSDGFIRAAEKSVCMSGGGSVCVSQRHGGDSEKQMQVCERPTWRKREKARWIGKKKEYCVCEKNKHVTELHVSTVHYMLAATRFWTNVNIWPQTWCQIYCIWYIHISTLCTWV